MHNTNKKKNIWTTTEKNTWWHDKPGEAEQEKKDKDPQVQKGEGIQEHKNTHDNGLFKELFWVVI